MKTLNSTEVQELDLSIHPQGIFAGIESGDMNALESAGEWLETNDDMIIQDGHEQNYLYLVVSGKVEVFKYNNETQKKQVLAQLGEGSCMGEIAFIRGDVASANVKSLRKTILWRIDHATLKQYISEYPGGGQLCLNLADVLAQRVQEGNTRLVGVTQSLSAYFGHMARKSDQKDIEAPLAAGMADMEIPQDIYNMFVCETLEYEEGAQVGDEHRQYVDELIKNNEVDFISWLEEGQRGQKLKVILKFAQLDEDGNVIKHEEEPPSSTSAESPATSAKGKVGPAGVSLASKRSHMVRVPQVQARVKGHTAVIKEKPDRLWQIIHYGAYILLPIVTALTILKFLPLESRIGIAKNSTYQALPLTGIIDKVIFAPSAFSELGVIGKARTFSGSFNNPQEGYFEFSLKLDQPLQKDATISLKLYNYRTLEIIIDKEFELKAGTEQVPLGKTFISGEKHEFKFITQSWDEANVNCTFIANGKH